MNVVVTKTHTHTHAHTHTHTHTRRCSKYIPTSVLRNRPPHGPPLQDHALVKEHFDHQKAETQREQMRNEIDRMKRLLENNDTVVHKQVQ